MSQCTSDYEFLGSIKERFGFTNRICNYGHCFGLDRKIKLAKDCLGSYKGWTQSKTVLIKI